MKTRVFLFGLGIVVGGMNAGFGAEEIIADFEGWAYPKGWAKTGTAFGEKPAEGRIAKQKAVTGFKGKGLVNTFNPNDSAKGNLTSTEFVIKYPYIQFLIGGGYHPQGVGIRLMVEGKLVRADTGRGKTGADKEALVESGWDVKEFVGKKARLVIFDQQVGGWGHVNVDHIVQTTEAPKVFSVLNVTEGVVMAAEHFTKEVKVELPYLLLPVRSGKPMQPVLIYEGEKRVRKLSVNLANEKPDFWATLDVREFMGKTLRLVAEDKAVMKIVESKREADLPGMYSEELRPQVHFTANRGWINDPNGMVYHKGEWHLFFQHNPYGTDWENMHWGHAVSKDLVTWEELPSAFHPWTTDKVKGHAYSGSAVTDAKNTSGFGEGVMVAMFTDTGVTHMNRAEVIAFSKDGGRSFEWYEGNPLIPHRGRDPKTFWHEPTKKWVSVIYDETGGKRHFLIYSSPDLKAWTLESAVDGVDLYECPEFFELPVLKDGKATGEKLWVMVEAKGTYLLGDFDGKVFTPKSWEELPGSFGGYLYAAQTFNGAPDGRRIQIGWLRIRGAGMPFTGAMSLPVELTLRKTSEGVRLFSWPVAELEKLRKETKELKAGRVEGEKSFGEVPEICEVEAVMVPSAKGKSGMKIGNREIVYDAEKSVIVCAGVEAPVKLVDGKLELRVFVDRLVMEVFVNGGAVYVPARTLEKQVEVPVLKVFSGGGAVEVPELKVHELRSIWR